MIHTELLLVAGAAAFVVGLVVGIVVSRLAFAPGPDPRLFGTWLSDGDRTVAEWRDRRPMTDEQTAQLRAIVGKMRVTWGRRTYRADLDGQVNEYPYTVVDHDDHAVVIRGLDPLLNRQRYATLTFIDGGDVYWLHAADGPLREYFRRVHD